MSSDGCMSMFLMVVYVHVAPLLSLIINEARKRLNMIMCIMLLMMVKKILALKPVVYVHVH